MRHRLRRASTLAAALLGTSACTQVEREAGGSFIWPDRPLLTTASVRAIALAAHQNEERLDRLRDKGMAGPRRGEWDGPSEAEIHADPFLAPPVPADRTDIKAVVYREKLLKNFRGLLTYGSPLDKFAGLWPRTVALNRWSAVFPKEAAWLNVWDPTDPVAAELDAFDPDWALKEESSECNEKVKDLTEVYRDAIGIVSLARLPERREPRVGSGG